MRTHYFAWWNVENLFDVHDAPSRPPWLQKQLGSELKGWTLKVLDQKVKQLASVIQRMNEGGGPDLLGVCEVENANVLRKLIAALDLPNRDYAVAHHDGSDNRGIDVAFIYDTKLYRAGELFHNVIQKRTSTRDILQVNFELKSTGETFVVFGNHWPSRLGGTFESAPYRMMAGETLAYFHERARAHLGNEVPVIVMGDFNDGPGARSMVDYALSSFSKTRVKNARNPMLYNLMWPVLAKGRGTHVYGSDVDCLDQILVSKALLKDGGVMRLAGEVELVEFEGMTKGGYRTPRRFSRPAESSYD